MIIMETGATQEQIDEVIREVKKHGLNVDVSTGRYKTVIGLIGDERKIPFDHFCFCHIEKGSGEGRLFVP